jgi:hypothetical protein
MWRAQCQCGVNTHCSRRQATERASKAHARCAISSDVLPGLSRKVGREQCTKSVRLPPQKCTTSFHLPLSVLAHMLAWLAATTGAAMSRRTDKRERTCGWRRRHDIIHPPPTHTHAAVLIRQRLQIRAVHVICGFAWSVRQGWSSTRAHALRDQSAPLQLGATVQGVMQPPSRIHDLPMTHKQCVRMAYLAVWVVGTNHTPNKATGRMSRLEKSQYMDRKNRKVHTLETG